MVSTDTTKGNRLTTTLDLFAEAARSKDAVIAMVVLDGDSSIASEAFKGLFGFNGLQSTGRFLKVNIIQTREMIDKNSGDGVAAFGECSASLSH